MTDTLPAQFGNYVLLERIARGGMAEIYRAKVGGTVDGFAKLVAIKKILPHLAENEDFITMLKDEARICVSLSHSNIAQIYDLGVQNNSPFIAMEYVAGVDMANMLRYLEGQGYLMPIEHAVFVIHEISSALSYAHRKVGPNDKPLNIIHRDISPHNIMLSFDGDVKIIDFGIAKATVKLGQTQMGVIKGKLLYMAPEQAMGQRIDNGVDIFGAGMCLYKMVTGVLPYEADDAYQIYAKVLKGDIESPNKINPRIPDSLNRTLLKALAKNRKDRYADAWEFHQDLAAVLREIAPGYTSYRLEQFMGQYFGREKAKWLSDTSGSFPGDGSPSTGSVAERSYPVGQQSPPQTPPPRPRQQLERPRSVRPRSAQASEGAVRYQYDVVATTDGWGGAISDLARLLGDQFGISTAEIAGSLTSLKRSIALAIGVSSDEAERTREVLERMGVHAVVRRTPVTRAASPELIRSMRSQPRPGRLDAAPAGLGGQGGPSAAPAGLGGQDGTESWLQAVDDLFPDGNPITQDEVVARNQPPVNPPDDDEPTRDRGWNDVLGDAQRAEPEPGGGGHPAQGDIDIDVDFGEMLIADADETQRVPMNWKELFDLNIGTAKAKADKLEAGVPASATAVGGHAPEPSGLDASELFSAEALMEGLEQDQDDATVAERRLPELPPEHAEELKPTHAGSVKLTDTPRARPDAAPLDLESSARRQQAPTAPSMAEVGTQIGVRAVSTGHPVLAAILSAVIPGAGQVFNGQIFKGILFGLTFFLVVPWLVAIVDAFRSARRITQGGGHLISTFIYGVIWLLVVLGLGTYGSTFVLERLAPADAAGQISAGDKLAVAGASADVASGIHRASTRQREAASDRRTERATEDPGYGMTRVERVRAANRVVTQGRGECGRGEYVSCKIYMDKAIALDPNNKEAWRYLVRAQTKISADNP